ncbi:MAG: TlpA disulfide reductase family protein [Mariprofundaceae bacterium]|nr:TlpA disulfide reductase family protein [Mariprofundaceae bacterium]
MMALRWLAVIGLVVGMVTVAFMNMPEPQKKIQEGDSAIVTTLPDVDGQPHSLPQGEVVLLHFWATWCAPCREEIPSMVAMYNVLKAQGLKVFAVSTDKNGDDVREFIQLHHISFPVVRDVDVSFANRYGITGYPETYIINRQGVVVKHIVGPAPWQNPDTRAWLMSLLKESPKRQGNSTAAVRQPGA